MNLTSCPLAKGTKWKEQAVLSCDSCQRDKPHLLPLKRKANKNKNRLFWNLCTQKLRHPTYRSCSKSWEHHVPFIYESWSFDSLFLDKIYIFFYSEYFQNFGISVLNRGTLCLKTMVQRSCDTEGRWLVRRRLYLRIYGYFPMYISFIRAPVRNHGNRLSVVIVVVVFDTTALENLDSFKATLKFWRCIVHENLATKTKKCSP